MSVPAGPPGIALYPKEAEIEKARTGARSGFINSVGNSLQRARLLSQYAMFYDKPDLIADALKKKGELEMYDADGNPTK